MLMQYEPVKIVDNLYQGSFPPYGDTLSSMGFDVLVLCASEHQHADPYANIQVICAGGQDTEKYASLLTFVPNWKLAAKQVADAIIDGKKVLVTCMAGHNRSGFVIGLALGELFKLLPGSKIVDLIKTANPPALYNKTMCNYIQDYVNNAE